MIPLMGFCPDLDASTPGVLVDVSNIIPTERGFAGAPTGQAPSGVSALAAACRGAAVATLLGGTRRVFAGTQTRLYELVSTTWTDRSRAGNYTGSSESRWSFTQFGDTTIAADDTAVLQASSSGAFADISGAPVARIVLSSNNFVIALNTSTDADGWHCSALLDHTDWTESVSTQCASGRLVSVPGEITAGLPFGTQIVVYKAKGMYVGTYVGAPSVWQFDQLPGEQGCIGPEAVCDVSIDGSGSAQVFVGEDNIYLFDGTRPYPIAKQLRQWFFNNSSPTYRYKTVCTFDRQNNRVWIFFPSRNSTTCDTAIVFHLLRKEWGKVTVSVEAALNYVSPGYTIDGLSSLSSTIDGLPDIPFDSQYWIAGGRALSYFDTSHQLKTLTGVSGSSSITSWDDGDDEVYTTLQGVRARFLESPDTGAGETFYKNDLGDDVAVGSMMTMSGSRFDALQSARWHRVRLDFTGDHEITAIRFNKVADGTE